MTKIKDPRRPWEIFHMDWVTGLPPGVERRYNSFLVIADRFAKTTIFLPFQKYDTAMETALLIWNMVVSWACISTKVLRNRDPKFTSVLMKNPHHCFGTKLSFSTAYHQQTDCLTERMLYTLEGMVRNICTYGLVLKYYDGFTNYGCTLLPALELE
ncbi:hypothetical protein O181_011666 [Austropuccinia psidii MF-1]|uniref:Integrase catalytic domain-containing protein n=1 Tax=Austropuccinia psidii MF-1 TaxID=1389203 RepID=A0A9Q3BW64_9BASI|nr:hypothetical protein [Austropuccinia psidii MF-1]